MLAHTDSLLAQLERLHPKKIDLVLTRMERLLARLGNPQTAMPPAIHIAGTNGKGSVLAFLGAMLSAGGRSYHRYTSPHLQHFHERIGLLGRDIGESALAQLLAECQSKNGGAPITFFEITTAVAFLAFARQPADHLLLEVGLGGRLDATNCAEHISASVITALGLDHQEFLGADIASIASEKAGILRPNIPAFIGRVDTPARAVIEKIAKEKNTPLAFLGQDFDYSQQREQWVYRDKDGSLNLPAPALRGAHQYDNAALAVAVARAHKIPNTAILQGIATARWAGRLTPLAHKNLELWLDGGHNPLAGEALAKWVQKQKNMPLVLVVAMLANKDAKGFLAPFLPLAPQVYAVPLPNSANGFAPKTLCATAQELGLEAKTADSVASALAHIAPPARVLVCGSLYLAGATLRDFAPTDSLLAS